MSHSDPIGEVVREMHDSHAHLPNMVEKWVFELESFWTPQLRGFVDISLEWGANSIKWDNANEPNENTSDVQEVEEDV